jgi:heavy metal sensor kinase
MSRVPIRLRLALAFALAAAAVLAATGAVLYVRLGSSLDEAIEQGLEARLADATALAAAGGTGAGGQPRDPEDSFTQLLDTDGNVLDAGQGVPGAAVLGSAELSSLAFRTPLRAERDAVPGLDGRARLLAAGVDTPSGRRVVVVGASLEERDEALGGLLEQLAVVGPVTLVLVSLLGYGIATAALRPVESMRAEAAAVSADAPGRRLRVPPARDELSRLASTLNEMLERLEAALERERTFVSDASHELRTPLALLQAELELALRRPRSAAELEAALRSASDEADRLTQLAEDLLVLARADQGKLQLRRQSVPARRVVAAVAERFARRADSEGRAIKVDAQRDLRIDVDVLRLEQALGNLVANALEHGIGTIRLSAVAENGDVELHVRDEGPGFPDSFLPRAFERFSRADDGRSGGGAGLGLAIVKVIATAHGGSAHVANNADAGADAWLAIPSRSGLD